MTEVGSSNTVPTNLVTPTASNLHSHCRRRLRIRLTSLVGSWVGFGIVNVITSLRVYALYGRSRNVLYLGISLWAAQLAAGGYAAFRIVLDYAHVLSSIPTNCSPCDPLYGVHIFAENNSAYKTRYTHMSAVIVCTLTSVTYLIMTLGKLRDSITDSGGRVRYEILKEASYVTPIAGVFISDGALSLLLLLVVDLATAICSLDNTMYYYSPTWPWMHAIFSHVGSSLILNLRRAGGRGTPTLIVKRQDETLDLDGVHLVV
ncbi:hypothetical protein FA13DRAFT_1741420 [Coprinellus micaceus]|uniref:Uncharacterized protein n=1 Tax=Coprinellus micaceus TaxID=71717 RepID=A0A4Y7SJ52_COPMI|nr:hypothetical protein FA13DRAFT_1741420 [Coprinellus micaceus]